jgi:hypothetical protein
VRLDAPDQQIHAVGETVPVAPHLDDRTVSDEGAHRPLQRRAFFARDLQHAHELAHRGGMMDALAHGAQQLIAIHVR